MGSQYNMSYKKAAKQVSSEAMSQLSPDELRFYSALITELDKNRISGNLTFGRISDDTLWFSIDPIGQIGRVKIQGRKTKMQIISTIEGSNDINVVWIEDLSVDEMIGNISKWIEYVLYCLPGGSTTQYTPQQPKPSKKKGNGLIVVISVIAIFIGIAALGSTSSSDKSTETPKTSIETTTETIAAEETSEMVAATVKTLAEEADVPTDPDYDVKILNYSIETDDLGKDFLLVEYEFTNHTDKSQSFAWSIDDKAFQNGVECDDLTVWSDLVDSNAAQNEIKPEVQYKLKKGYLLSDKESPVVIECSPLISFGDVKPWVNVTIDLTTMTSEENAYTTPEKSDKDYEVKILSTTLETTDKNEPYIVVKYEFTHYNNKATSFGMSVDHKVYQNGVECGGYIAIDKIDIAQKNLDVQAGVPYQLEVAYPLQNATDDVTIECYELIDFSDDPEPLAEETVKLS